MPKRDDPAALAERLIKSAGSKAEAHRLIDAAKARANPGRPAQYAMADAHVLLAVEMLENERRRAGVKAPKRRQMIKEAVSRALADGWHVGKTENAAIQRVSRHSCLFSSLFGMFSKVRKSDRSGDPGSPCEFWAEFQLPLGLSEWILSFDPERLNDFNKCVMLLWLKSIRSDQARSEALCDTSAGEAGRTALILSPKKI